MGRESVEKTDDCMSATAAAGFMLAIFASLGCTAIAFDWLVSFVR
ncbi:MAG: hypothetical protein JWM94_2523 [Sphingomonas bacterium]|nr:hypothetical protein [Sphingomonas bacterium]